jgi:hypothetical protein
MMKAQFGVAGRDHERNIVFLEDIANHTGGMTITNDAEAVFDHWAHISGWHVRVVYRDTDNQWWEIVKTTSWMGESIGFRPWYGEVWDRLQRL